MVRSIIAVVVGFVVTGCLIVGTTQGVMAAYPTPFDARGGTSNIGVLLLMHLYVAIYATFGSWLAARLAPSNPMRHALIVGALGAALNAFTVGTNWDMFPVWSNIISLVTPMLWGRIGGGIRLRQLAKSGTPVMATA